MDSVSVLISGAGPTGLTVGGRSHELLQVREFRDGHKAGPRHSMPARRRIAGVPPPVGRACPVAGVRRVGAGGSSSWGGARRRLREDDVPARTAFGHVLP